MRSSYFGYRLQLGSGFEKPRQYLPKWSMLPDRRETAITAPAVFVCTLGLEDPDDLIRRPERRGSRGTIYPTHALKCASYPCGTAIRIATGRVSPIRRVLGNLIVPARPQDPSWGRAPSRRTRLATRHMSVSDCRGTIERRAHVLHRTFRSR
jgi:hypothetical protein